MNTVVYLISVLVALAVGVVELVTRLRSRPTLREGAWVWWTLRLVFDGAAGVLTAWLLLDVAGADWDYPVLTGVAAGASATALVRQRFATVGETPIGIATVYEYFRRFFDAQIDRCGSENDSKWINDVVLPALRAAGTTPRQVATRIADYVAGLSEISAGDRLDEQATIQAIVADATTDDDTKIRALIDVARRLKAFKTIRNLCKQALEQANV